MIYTVNRKTKVEHTFNEAQWEDVKVAGLANKFKVLQHTEENEKPALINFSPPELRNKVEKLIDDVENSGVKPTRKKVNSQSQ